MHKTEKYINKLIDNNHKLNSHNNHKNKNAHKNFYRGNKSCKDCNNSLESKTNNNGISINRINNMHNFYLNNNNKDKDKRIYFNWCKIDY